MAIINNTSLNYIIQIAEFIGYQKLFKIYQSDIVSESDLNIDNSIDLNIDFLAVTHNNKLKRLCIFPYLTVYTLYCNNMNKLNTSNDLPYKLYYESQIICIPKGQSLE